MTTLAVFPQASGETGVKQTLMAMARLVNGAMLDPLIRDQAAYAIAGCPRGYQTCHAHALLSWVNRQVRYVPDPTGVEALHDPRLLARAVESGKFPYGDCDDLSMYLAALMKAIGLQPVFRAVGYNGKPFQHVYVRYMNLTLDATRDAWTVSLGSHRETSIMELTV